MEYKIAYNPYKVNMKISIKDKEGWIPISQNSVLTRFSRIRLQRCLNDKSNNSFFSELCNSAGDDEIDISFWGTDEDYIDFQEAVFEFNCTHPGYHINLKKNGISNSSNSTKCKYESLLKLAAESRKSKYNFLISDKIWTGISRALTLPSNEAVLVSLEQWKNSKENIFSNNSWRMFCFEFCYEDLKLKDVHNAFRELSKKFEELSDRPFERERFEFICKYNNSTEVHYNVLKKILMEYGIQDIDYVLINENDYKYLDDPDADEGSDTLKDLQQHIITFKKRYASQYKLRKDIDTLQNQIQKEELISGPKLKRKIDSALKERKIGNKFFSDKEVEEAYEWLINLLSNINCILELET